MTQNQKIIGICLFLAIIPNLFAETENNFDCLSRLTDTVLLSPVNLLPDSSSVIYLNATVPRADDNWFLETALIRQLKQRFPGIQIRSYSPANSFQLKPHDVLITYQILNLGIVYEIAADKKHTNFKA